MIDKCLRCDQLLRERMKKIIILCLMLFMVVSQEKEVVIAPKIMKFHAVSQKPRILKKVRLLFDAEAKKSGVQGMVLVEFIINKDGLAKTKVIKGPKELHQSALNAANQYRFTPAFHHDKPVFCRMIIPFRFMKKNKFKFNRKL